MKRRTFLNTASLPVFLTGLLPGLAQAGEPQSTSLAHSYFFYDERFVNEKLFTRDWGFTGERFPVQSDITPLWNSKLKSASQYSLVKIEGITTESFYFCLQRMLHLQASANKITMSCKRLDKNLFVWSIVSSNPVIDKV